MGLLPLVDDDGAAMRVRFTTSEEAADEASLLERYLDCVVAPPPAAEVAAEGGGGRHNGPSEGGLFAACSAAVCKTWRPSRRIPAPLSEFRLAL